KLEQLESYGEELGSLVKFGLLSEAQLMSGHVISGRHISTGLEFVFVVTAESQIFYARRGLAPVLVSCNEPIPGAGAIPQLAAFREIALADGNYILFVPTPRGMS